MLPTILKRCLAIARSQKFPTLHNTILITICFYLALVGDVAAQESSQLSQLRGWDHLVSRLEKNGMNRNRLMKIYSDKRIPQHENVPFSVLPKESNALYNGFFEKKSLDKARAFFKKYRTNLKNAELKFGVDRKVIVAILYIETQFGENTGEHLVLYRLSRLSTVNESKNILWNFQRLTQEDLNRQIKFEEVKRRAQYLEDTFLKEIIALDKIAQRKKIDIFAIKGSFAGAIGWPQFLPSSYINYAVDGDGDRKISLFNPHDAIYSVANYLKKHGWKSKSTREEKREVIWYYNKSHAYIEAVLGVVEKL
jgi:membrane-bound lytic murein transglycosylase B